MLEELLSLLCYSRGRPAEEEGGLRARLGHPVDYQEIAVAVRRRPWARCEEVSVKLRLVGRETRAARRADMIEPLLPVQDVLLFLNPECLISLQL